MHAIGEIVEIPSIPQVSHHHRCVVFVIADIKNAAHLVLSGGNGNLFLVLALFPFVEKGGRVDAQVIPHFQPHLVREDRAHEDPLIIHVKLPFADALWQQADIGLERGIHAAEHRCGHEWLTAGGLRSYEHGAKDKWGDSFHLGAGGDEGRQFFVIGERLLEASDANVGIEAHDFVAHLAVKAAHHADHNDQHGNAQGDT